MKINDFEKSWKNCPYSSIYISNVPPQKVGPNSRVSVKANSTISFSSPTPRKFYTVYKWTKDYCISEMSMSNILNWTYKYLGCHNNFYGFSYIEQGQKIVLYLKNTLA